MLLLAAALVVAVAIAGCGGDSSTATGEQTFSVKADTTMTAGSITKAQFIDRVDKICHDGMAVVRKNFTEYSGWQSPHLSKEDLFAKAVRLSFLAGLDFEVFDKIFLLKAPEGETKQVEEVIGAMQLAVERGQRELRVPSPAQLTALFADYNQRAREYGLNGECLVDGTQLKAGA